MHSKELTGRLLPASAECVHTLPQSGAQKQQLACSSINTAAPVLTHISPHPLLDLCKAGPLLDFAILFYLSQK